MTLSWSLLALGPGAPGYGIFCERLAAAATLTAVATPTIPGAPALGPTLSGAPSAPGAARAENGFRAVNPQEAMRFLEANGAFRGPDDALRGYMITSGGTLTPIGEKAYEYFKQHPREVQDFQPAFDRLREAGRYSAKKDQAVQAALTGFDKEFGGVAQAGAEDSWTLGAQLNAILTGAATAEPQSKPLVQIETPTGYDFMDEQGLAVRMNKNGVTLYNRELARNQRLMNDPRNRPACAPHIPENGRYNYEMFVYSECRLDEQIDKINKATHADRIMRMAELLGRQLQPDQVLQDIPAKLGEKGPLEREIENRKTVGGWVVKDLVDPHLTKRWAYLAQAGRALEFFRSQMRQLKELRVVGDASVKAMEQNERLVVKYVTLAYLDAQRFNTLNQLERLDYEVGSIGGVTTVQKIRGDSPDSKVLREAIANSNLSAEQKQAYLGRAAQIAGKLKHLLDVFDVLDGKLTTADYASQLDRAQDALGQTQKELGNLGLDVMIYNAMPTLAKVARDESSGFRFKWTPRDWRQLDFVEINGVTPSVTRAGARALNSVSRLWGGDAGGGYLRDRDRMDRLAYGDAFLGALRAIADQGDLRAVEQALLQMDPGAIRTHWTAGFEGSPGDPTDAQRLEAALRKAQESLQTVAKVHVYTGIAVHIVGWSLAGMIVPPFLSAGMSGLGGAMVKWGQRLMTAEQAGAAARTVGFVLRGTGMILENTAQRLQKLGPPPGTLRANSEAMKALEVAAVRFANTGIRLTAFTGMSSGISGAFVAGKHLWDGDRSPYASVGEAFGQGAAGGAKWATDSWHPLLLVTGLPSNVTEGTRAAAVSEAIATRGAAGLGSSLAQKGLKLAGMDGAAQGLERYSLRNLMSVGEAGGWINKGAKFTAQVAGTLDNVAKFMLPSYGFGWAAREYSYHFNTFDDPSRIERRIERAEAAGLTAMQAPIWLALPVHPAAAEAASAEALAAEQGLRERIARNETDAIINAGEGGRLKLYEPPEVPILQRIFNFQLYREKAAVGGEQVDAAGTFKVNKDVLRRAVQHELPYAASGRRPGEAVDPESVNPLDYYKISQIQGQRKVGRIWVNDVVRDEAYGYFSKTILKKPALAEKVMDPKNLGRMVEGFGRVGARHQEDVALVLYGAAKDAQAKVAVSPRRLQMAETLLEPYLKTEEAVGLRASELRRALTQGRPSPAMKEYVENILQRTRDWKAEMERTKGQGTKTYMDLVAEFRREASKRQGALGPADQAVVAKVFDYVESVQSRFNHFNRLGAASGRLERALETMKTENAGDPAARAGLELMRLKMKDLVDKAAQKDPRGLESPAKDLFRDLRKLIERNVDSEKAQGFSREDLELLAKRGGFSSAELAGLGRVRQLSKSQVAVLESALREVEAAPWLLKDSKGTSLPGWRPEQFEALMEFFSSLMGSERPDVVRTFLMLKTGGGKTLLSIEGLSPLLEANGKKTVFLTVQTNLESQARMEFRALRKVVSKLTFDTWEGFKTQIAQGKMRGGGAADKWNILGDEADGAASQPILTVGERTASVGRTNGVYSRLERIGERLEEIVGGGGPKTAELEFLAERVKGLAEETAAQSAEGIALRRNAADLGRAARSLGQARTPEAFAQAEARVRSLLAKQELILGAEPLKEGTAAEISEGLSALEPLARRLEAAGGARSDHAPSAAGEDARLAGGGAELRDLAKEVDAVLALQQSSVSKLGGDAPQARILGGRIQSARVQFAEWARKAAGGSAGDPLALSLSPEGREGGVRGDADLAQGARILRNLASGGEALTAGGGAPVGGELGEAFKGLRGEMTRALEAAAGRRRALDGFSPEAKPSGLIARLQEATGRILLAATGPKWLRAGPLGRVRAGSLAAPSQELALVRELEQAKLDGNKELAEKDAARLEALRGHRKMVEQIQDLLSAQDAALRNARWLKRGGEGEGKTGGIAQARAEISEVSRRVLELARRGEPGWRDQARELLEKRQALVQRSVEPRNPIYEVYRSMRESMNSHFNSTFRRQSDSQALREAPGRLKTALDANAEALTKDLESAAARLRALEPPALETEGRAEIVEGEPIATYLRNRTPAAQGPRARLEALLREVQAQESEIEAKAAQAGEVLDPRRTGPGRDAYQGQVERYKASAEKIMSSYDAIVRLEEELKVAAPERKADVQKKIDAARAEYKAEGDRAREVLRLMRLGEKAKREEVLQVMAAGRRDAAALASRWREQAARLKDESADPEVRGALEAFARDVDAQDRVWESQSKRLEMTSDKALEVLNRRLDGLTKIYARKLLSAIYRDPLMPPAQKWKLIWTIAPSTLWPRGLGGGGSSWVRTELINLAKGYGDDPNTIRMDHSSGYANAVHVGQWFESMDTPTRRFWELEFGADLTLPYEHRTKATMNDIIENQKVNLVAFSGTASERFRGILTKNKIDIRGVGSKGAEAKLEIVGTTTQKYAAILEALKAASGDDATLVITVLPGTHELKTVEAIVLDGGLTPEQLAKVFSDAEFLRVNRGQAQVLKQMNLSGLDVGRIKHMTFDARVAGRGLDLNYKGDRGNPSPDAFKGYKKIVMLILDPQMMSHDMLVQAQGRIDAGRVGDEAAKVVSYPDLLAGANGRAFRLILDIPTAEKDPVFSDMIEQEPLFFVLRRDPKVVELARSKGLPEPDWATIHEYVSDLEAKGQNPALTRHYREVIERYLSVRQGEVGEDQLRSSGVLNDRPASNSNRMLRGLEAYH